MSNYRHGHKPKAAASPEYACWNAIRARCDNPHSASYERYGRRGIKMCDSWKADFAAFLADMGPRPSPLHSVERVNNDGHYEPSNCRWATAREQANNRRSSKLVCLDGETRTIAEWCRLHGLKPSTVCQREKAYGWSIERALTTPTRGAA